jgi:hypothetical protein
MAACMPLSEDRLMAKWKLDQMFEIACRVILRVCLCRTMFRSFAPYVVEWIGTVRSEICVPSMNSAW